MNGKFLLLPEVAGLVVLYVPNTRTEMFPEENWRWSCGGMADANGLSPFVRKGVQVQILSGLQSFCINCSCGGMAYTEDSKSFALKGVRVRISPRAPIVWFTKEIRMVMACVCIVAFFVIVAFSTI